jgi:hypothetical protein
MRAHLFAIAVVGLTFAAVASADPAKAPVSNAGQASDQPAPVMVAAADPARDPSADEQQQPQQPSAADKPQRHARVTTCRCGGQTPSN